MTRLVFIRHGESLGNLQRRFLGHTDWDLTERGYKQAECTAKYLENTHFDAIYSSDLMRAYNTVVPIAKKRGMDIIKEVALREISAGKWEGMGYDEIQMVYPEGHKTWMEDLGSAVCPDGESVVDLQTRVNAAIERIVAENKGKTVNHSVGVCRKSTDGTANNINPAVSTKPTAGDFQISIKLLDPSTTHLILSRLAGVFFFGASSSKFRPRTFRCNSAIYLRASSAVEIFLIFPTLTNA